MKYLFITIAISGSGKSHFLNIKDQFVTDDENDMCDYLTGFEKMNIDLLDEHSIPYFKDYQKRIVEPDGFRKTIFGDVNYGHTKEKWLWETLETSIHYHLDTHNMCILDSTMIVGRNKFLKPFLNDDTKVIAIVFKNDLELSKSRIKKDLSNKKNRSAVPEEILIAQNKNFIRKVIGVQDYESFVWDETTKDKITKQISEHIDIVKIIE